MLLSSPKNKRIQDGTFQSQKTKQKNKQKTTLKRFLIFGEMEL